MKERSSLRSMSKGATSYEIIFILKRSKIGFMLIFVVVMDNTRSRTGEIHRMATQNS